MAVKATMIVPSDIQRGNFNVPVTFESPVDSGSFGPTVVTLTAISNNDNNPDNDNGIMGVSFVVSGSDTTYNLTFQLPQDVGGSFRIGITGEVMVSGVSHSVTVGDGNKVVTYDTITSVSATFGTIRYSEGGVVKVPVTFDDNVIVRSETAFLVTLVSGDALPGIDYWLVGGYRLDDDDVEWNDEFELIFEIPPDRKGIFKVSGDGYVIRKSTGSWVDFSVDPILIGYRHIVPQIENLTIPVEIAPDVFQSVISFDEVALGVWTSDFSYGVELDDTPNVISSVLFRSLNFEVLPDLPVLVDENSLEESNCLDDWERVSAVGSPWGVGRFFVLRFRRKSTDDRTPDLVLNSGSWGGYFDA